MPLLKEKWYKEGLSFACTQCGNCCTGGPGYVWTSKDEARQIARFLELDLEVFLKRYAKRVGFKYSLKEKSKAENYDCVFLEKVEGKRICTIYPVRPVQCRTWPFWSQNLRTKSAWEDAAQDCPGMNQGKHHAFVQIEVQRTKTF